MKRVLMVSLLALVLTSFLGSATTSYGEEKEMAQEIVETINDGKQKIHT